MSARKAKFRVGQVVRVVGSKFLRSLVPDYFRVTAVKPHGRTYQYQTSDHETRGPWIASKQLRPLTSRERGRA